MISGCGGGGGGNGGDGTGSVEEGTGAVYISLTDAPSDFASYTVDIVSISLKKYLGAEVETLPLKQRVDFSQYTDMTEFVTACTIPVGVYTKATMTLDYSNADIKIKDGSGNIKQIDSHNITLLDDNGNAVQGKQISVTVDIENLSSLVILPGVPRHLALDFNLDATNEVDLDNLTLTVSPLLIADLNPQNNTHRVCGLLSDVQRSNNRFYVEIKPFIPMVQNSDGLFGKIRVSTGDGTLYFINGKSYQGSDGLNELARSEYMNDSVLVLGELSVNPYDLLAQEVYVGSSVPWKGSDNVVNGNVTARSGNIITIRGVSIVNTDGRLQFYKTAKVELDESSTRVSRQFSQSAFSIDDISVGQRVMVFFSSSNANNSADGEITIAPANAVRMMMTHLRGIVTKKSTGIMEVEIKTIDCMKHEDFNFSNAGTYYNKYKIAASNTLLQKVKAGNRVKVWGFVNQFGHADNPDFNATTLINISKALGLMHVNWKPAYEKAFSQTDNSLILNYDQLGKFHFLYRAGLVDNIVTDFSGQAAIKSANSGIFIVQQGIPFFWYTDFSKFLDKLEEYNGYDVRYITAIGTFDDDTASLSAGYLIVRYLGLI